MRAQRTRRRRESGQGAIEVALVVLLLLMTLLGVFAVSTLANDQNTATTAVRAGGRFAAELGNGSLVVPAPTTTAVDNQIVAEVCKVATTLPDLLSITSIIIYKPQANPDGSYNVSDLTDSYNVSTPLCQISAPIRQQYTLNLRVQTHPNEAQVGIYIEYHYVSPTPIIHIDLQAHVYTVVTVAPSFA